MRRLLPAPSVELDDLWPLYALPSAPHLRVGFVTSLDGAVVLDGSSRALSSPADRVALRTLRAVGDVVLVGAGTARQEDYGPVPLPADLRQRRADEGRPERPAVAVATRSMRLDPAARLLSDPQHRVLLLAPERAVAPAGLPGHVEVVRAGRDELDLAGALAALHERGLPRVLCEGGPTLLQGLAGAGLVDELCLTTSGLLVGGAPGLLPAPLPGPLAARLVSLVEADGALLARWSLR